MRALRCFLSPEEIGRADRYRFARDRERFVLTRGWLRVVLARCIGVTPEQIAFSYPGTNGKPALAPPHRASALTFNVSHSGDYSLIGLSGGRSIGVDIERVRPMPEYESIAEGYFSPAEARGIATLAEADRLRAFFRCWTRKEAFMKATGEGMGIALDAFTVSLDEAAETAIPMADFPGGTGDDWIVTGLSLTRECEAAIAVDAAGLGIAAWLDPVSL